MKIFTVNNKTEEKFLRKKTADFDFSKFTKKEIQELIIEMKATMKAANGVGLSANQIGLDMQLFVAELPKENSKPEFYAIFNPILSKPSAKKTNLEEGCLSVPGIWGDVSRPEKITLTGFDKNQKKIKIKAIGFLAKIFQHEVDHLNGTLFIDKATNLHEHEPKENNGRI